MKRSLSRRQSRFRSNAFCAVFILILGIWNTRADQVRMQNGDSYFGNVVSLDSETLVLKSDVLGTVRLPRNKLAGVAFGVIAKSAAPATSLPSKPFPLRQPLASTNSSSELTAAFSQLGADSNLVQQIQAQFLGGAGAEANDKFNQLLGGLMSGKLNLNDLRTEAKSAADQVRAVRKDLGEDAGVMVDGYLAILDSFLKETTPASGAVVTNSPSLSLRPKPTAAEDE